MDTAHNPEEPARRARRAKSLPVAVPLIGLVLLSAAVVAAASAGDDGRAAGTTFFYKGSVVDVIAGTVNKQAHEWVESAAFAAGFEVGTPGPTLDSLGEMLSVNGVTYSRSTDSTSPNYYKTLQGTKFLSTGAVFLPHGAVPDTDLEFTAPRGAGPMGGLSIDSLYNALYHKLSGAPFCYMGVGHFSYLHATAIAKAPIYGQNIFTHKAEYYTQPAINSTAGVDALLFGCAANFTALVAEGDKALLQGLERVLYHNPQDVHTDLTVHTHILQLAHPVPDPSHVGPSVVTGVNHLFSDAVLSSINVSAYAVKGIVPLPTNTRAQARGTSMLRGDADLRLA